MAEPLLTGDPDDPRLDEPTWEEIQAMEDQGVGRLRIEEEQ